METFQSIKLIQTRILPTSEIALSSIYVKLFKPLYLNSQGFLVKQSRAFLKRQASESACNFGSDTTLCVQTARALLVLCRDKGVVYVQGL